MNSPRKNAHSSVVVSTVAAWGSVSCFSTLASLRWRIAPMRLAGAPPDVRERPVVYPRP
jgi:hypothetical protein